MSTIPQAPRLAAQREKVIRLARSLARSGAYPDLDAVLKELEHVQGFHAALPRLENQALRSQLNTICRHARSGRTLRLQHL